MPSKSIYTTETYFPNGYPGIDSCEDGMSCNPFNEFLDGFSRVLCYGDSTMLRIAVDENHVPPNIIKPEPKCCLQNKETGICESITDKRDSTGSNINCSRANINKNPGQNPTWVHDCCRDLGSPDEVGSLPCNKRTNINCSSNPTHPCCQTPPLESCYNDTQTCCECRCSDTGFCQNTPDICSSMNIIGRNIPCESCPECCSNNNIPTYHGDLFTDPCCRKRNESCDDKNCCVDDRLENDMFVNTGCYDDTGNSRCKYVNTSFSSYKGMAENFIMMNVMINNECVLVRCGNGGIEDPCTNYESCYNIWVQKI